MQRFCIILYFLFETIKISISYLRLVVWHLRRYSGQSAQSYDFPFLVLEKLLEYNALDSNPEYIPKLSTPNHLWSQLLWKLNHLWLMPLWKLNHLWLMKLWKVYPHCLYSCFLLNPEGLIFGTTG